MSFIMLLITSLISRHSNITVALTLVFLSACSGGGSSTIELADREIVSANTPTPIATPSPIVSSGPQFRASIFEPETNFQGTCDVVYENFWLRSWTNRTYLWYNEVIDQNPYEFNTALSYFDVLRTNAITRSGVPRDQFHFTFSTEEWQQLTNSGASSGYGIRWKIVNPSPPREIRIAYVEPNTPAFAANLVRGLRVSTIDGVDAINGNDVGAINNGLFPSENDQHNFILVDDNGNQQNVTLNAQTIVSQPVLLNSVINNNGDNVGYLLLNSFSIRSAEQQLIDAFNNFRHANVRDLVVDLRYNSGGLLAISSQLAYMVAGSNATVNRTFELLNFNDKHPNIDPVLDRTITPTPFYDTTLGFSASQGTALPSLDLRRVFVLTSDSTCSASESFMNGLRGVDIEVIMIGGTTCGKPYGFYPTDNCGTTYFTIQFSGINDKGYGDYADGLFPSLVDNGEDGIAGCVVTDDFSNQLGDSNEGLLSAALFYRQNNSCPPTSQSNLLPRSVSNNEQQIDSLLNTESARMRIELEQRRLY